MYRPKDRDELEQLIVDCYYGKLYLNEIDVSLITDMGHIFNVEYHKDIDINTLWDNPKNDISDWNTSNVDSMYAMFYKSKFNQDISKWDISNVIDMRGMFAYSKFNQDISKWDLSNVKYINYMFAYSEFNQDISEWILSLDNSVYIKKFNKKSKHGKIYGRINSYEDFIKSVNWNSIKEIMINSNNQKRYEILKRLNSIKQINDIELEISIN